jgi:hypothetical protein
MVRAHLAPEDDRMKTKFVTKLDGDVYQVTAFMIFDTYDMVQIERLLQRCVLIENLATDDDPPPPQPRDERPLKVTFKDVNPKPPEVIE